VWLRLKDNRIEDIRFEGKGCAISTASASLMTEAVRGKDRASVADLYGKVHALLTEQDAVPDAALGKLAALSGVRQFPARVKCASLCWHTLNAALERRDATVSTE
jgi:nitrogen fixation NifU-like protein